MSLYSCFLNIISNERFLTQTIWITLMRILVLFLTPHPSCGFSHQKTCWRTDFSQIFLGIFSYIHFLAINQIGSHPRLSKYLWW